jgi:hypothetical protein
VFVGDERAPRLRRGGLGSWDRHARRADGAWRGAAAVLLIVIGVVHLHLWLDGYRHLNTIGPLFLLDVVAAALLAAVVAVRLNVLVAMAAASFAAGTLGANVLSLLLPNGLFEFKEGGVSYAGGFAIASEMGVVVLLGTWTYLRWRRGDLGWRRRPVIPSQSSTEQPPPVMAMGAPGPAPSTSRPEVTPLPISSRIRGPRRASASTEPSQRRERTR